MSRASAFVSLLLHKYNYVKINFCKLNEGGLKVMICSACHTDYNFQSHKWDFEGKGDQGEAMYVVRSSVYTSKILTQILEHAVLHQLIGISIDASLAEYEPCEGCQLLNLRQRKERDELLDLPKYRHFDYYDAF